MSTFDSYAFTPEELEERVDAIVSSSGSKRRALVEKLAEDWFVRFGFEYTEWWQPQEVASKLEVVFDDQLSDDEKRVVRAIFAETLRALKSGRPVAMEVLPPQNKGKHARPKTSRKANQIGDPVEHARGEFVHHATDLVVQGAGIDFTFERTYRHQTFYEGPLGHRWDHGYNLSLSIDDLGATLSIGAGYTETYVRHGRWGASGFDYYVPPDGVDATLEPVGPRDAPTGWVRRAPDGLRHLFARGPDGHGWRLDRIEDRWGNYLEFVYAADAYRVDRVHVNHRDRWVQFAYDSTGRIIRLTDHMGRAWHYRYDSHGDLVAVTTPATASSPRGDTTTYRYASDERTGPLAHLLTDIFDAAGRHYLHTVYGVDPGDDSYGKVVKQRVGTGEYAFRYEDVRDPDLGLPLEDRPMTTCWVRERNGFQTHYVYNPWGALLWKQELDRGPGHTPRQVVWQYRYNRDGAVVASRTLEGVVRQVITGRDHFLRRHRLSRSPAEDDRLWDHEALTADVRRGFGRVLATVDRAQRHAGGIVPWEDRFRDVYAVDPDDIVARYTYEDAYGQLLTASDPRVTTASDPDAVEPRSVPPRPTDYDWRLTRYEYAGPARDLVRTVLPAPTLPDGTVGEPAVAEVLERDHRGRVTRARDPVGVEVITRYVAADDARNGFVESVTVDAGDPAAGHLNLTSSFEIDRLGRVIKTTLPRAIEDQDAFVVEAEYDELDRVTRSRTATPLVTETRTTYEAAGKPRSSETDWTSPVETGRDAVGEPFVAVGERFVYDEEHRVREEYSGGTDVRDQRRVAHRYNGAGLRSITVAANDTATLWRYDSRDQLVQTVHGPGAGESIEEVRYDRDGRVVAQRSPEGRTTTFEHDAFGRVLQVTDPLGHVTRTSYDKAGQPLVVRHFERTEVLDDDGTRREAFTLLARSEIVYDELGRAVRAIASRFETLPPPVARSALATAYEAGLGATVHSREIETRTFYDALGRVVRVVDAMGHTTLSEYDAAGRVVQVVGPAGDVVRTRYDAHGNAIRVDRIDVVRDLNGNAIGTEAFTTLATYDARDRLITETDPLGNVTQHEYDSLDREVRTTDPLGNVIEHIYNVHGDVVEVRTVETSTGDVDGALLPPHIVRFEHDPAGLVTARIDALGRRTELRYDKQNRLVEEILPGGDGARLVTQYDRDSLVTAVRDAHGVVIRNRFDDAGRLVQTAVDTAEVDAGVAIEGSRQIERTYDGLGRVRSSRNETSSITAAFDSLGLVLGEQTTVNVAGSPTTFLVGREFDDLGRLTRLVYPGGRRLAYGYDAASRLRAIQHIADGAGYPGSAGGGVRTMAVYAHAGDRVRAIAFNNESTATFTHDAGGAVIDLHHERRGSTILRVQELRDGVRTPRLRREERPDGSQLDRFGYDSRQQLTARVPAAPAAAFDVAALVPAGAPPPGAPTPRQPSIDALIGPRIGVAAPLGADRWQYDKVGNRTAGTVAGDLVEFGADDRDRYERVGTAQFEYDRAGNLISDGDHDYVYDGFRRLVRVRVHGGADVVRYAYDPAGRRVIEERPAAAPAEQRLVIAYDGDDRIADFHGTTCVAQYVHGAGVDDPIELAAGGVEHTYHTDLQGSVRALTTVDGAVAASYRFDPFGVLLASSGAPLGPPGTGTAAATQPFGYASRPIEPATGQYDFRARVYVPALGRFLQRDPAGAVDGHLYTFAGNDPLAFGDTSGLARAERFLGLAMDVAPDLLGAAQTGFSALSSALSNPTENLAAAQSRLADEAKKAALHSATVRAASKMRVWVKDKGWGQLGMDLYHLMEGIDPKDWKSMKGRVEQFALAAGKKIYETRGGALGRGLVAAGNFSLGAFDEVTLGGTRALRSLTPWDDAVDYGGAWYGVGEYAGMVGLIVPGRALVGLGRRGLRRLAARGFWRRTSAASAGAVRGSVSGLLTRASRFFYDPREFRTISREYWKRRGGANGRSLDHWLFHQKHTWVPRGIRNAGMNLFDMPGFRGVFHPTLGFNQWRGLAKHWGGIERVKAIVADQVVRVVVIGSAAGSGYGGYQLGEELSDAW